VKAQIPIIKTEEAETPLYAGSGSLYLSGNRPELYFHLNGYQNSAENGESDNSHHTPHSIDLVLFPLLSFGIHRI
jgi:hypothetical protein